jgi:transposase-like protein
MKRRQAFSREFKLEAVRLLEEGTVSLASGDLPKDMLRNQITKRTENPQHPSQSRANRQKTRRPSKEVSANPPHCGYGNGSSCPV